MLSVMWGSSYLNWTLAAPGEVTRNLSLQEKNPVAGKCSLYRRSRRSSRRKCARQRGSSSVGRSLSVCPQQHVAAAGPWAGQDPAGLDKHIFEAPCPNILKDWGYTHTEQGALFKASFGFRCLRLQTIHRGRVEKAAVFCVMASAGVRILPNTRCETQRHGQKNIYWGSIRGSCSSWHQ